MNEPSRRACRAEVTWWDLDPHPRRCLRPRHRGDRHFDGTRWFDGNGLETPAISPVAPAHRGSGRAHAGWKERAGRPRQVDPRYRDKTDRCLAE